MDFTHPPRSVTLSLVGGRGHYESVVKAAMNAERTLWIATANLKALMVEDERARPGRRRTQTRQGNYQSIVKIFEERVENGVEIRLLHASPPSRAFQEELRRCLGLKHRARGSFELRLCPRIHAKLVIVDGAQVYVGSANWTGAGLGAKGEGRRNFELGIVSRDDLLLDEVQAYFDRIWRGQPCDSCQMRMLCPHPLDGQGTSAVPAGSILAARRPMALSKRRS